MLIGSVKPKNAIMQIDSSSTPSGGWHDAGRGIQRGCLIPVPAIMMTTMAALFGAVPIALGWARRRRRGGQLGLAVVAADRLAVVLTLTMTPVVYPYMAQIFKTSNIAARARKALNMERRERRTFMILVTDHWSFFFTGRMDPINDQMAIDQMTRFEERR